MKPCETTRRSALNTRSIAAALARLLAVIALLPWLSGVPLVAQRHATEDDVKAAYLYNFGNSLIGRHALTQAQHLL
jgi:anti-sigma-K factor RskA